MAKVIPFLGLVALAAGLTTSSTSATTTEAAVFTSENSKTAPDSITNGPTPSITVHRPTFPSLSKGQPSVRGLYLGSASVVNVADGKTTYSYICPASVTTMTSFGGIDDWNACDDEYARTATFIDGPSQYIAYGSRDWNTQTVTWLAVYGANSSSSWTETSTDSISHTVPLTSYRVCDVSGTMVNPRCSMSYSASAMNGVESSEVSSLNYVETAIYGGLPASITWEPSNWYTLGPVLAASGAEKLSGGAKTTGTQKNGAGKQPVRSSAGIVLAFFGFIYFL